MAFSLLFVGVIVKLSGPTQESPGDPRRESVRAPERTRQPTPQGSLASDAPERRRGSKGHAPGATETPDTRPPASRESAGTPSPPAVVTRMPKGTSRLLLRIEDRSGAPVAGIAVSLTRDRSVRTRDTDNRGHARFNRLAAGEYGIRVRHPQGRAELVGPSVTLGDADEEDIELLLPDLDLSIAGRVLLSDGTPIAGVSVFARSLSPRPHGRVLELSTSAERGTLSRADGSYTIGGLPSGDYEVYTLRTDRFARARVFAAAGTGEAILVVGRLHRLRVHGTITNDRGEPVAGARVVPDGESATFTDEDGNYEANFGRVPALHIRAAGYRNRTIRPSHTEDGGTLILDVQLEAIGETTEVSGIVRALGGRGLAGETVRVYAKAGGASFQATTDSRGRFNISNVPIGENYSLSVNPKSTYKDHTGQLEALRKDAPDLEIVLEPLGSARLVGRMIDVEGRPVPGFRLWLRSVDAARRRWEVAGDAAGRFMLEAAPAGRGSFETASTPNFRITGIDVGDGESAEIELVLDVGDHVLEGRILDAAGDPIGGAQVVLGWVHSEAGLRSTSQRRSRSDADGGFRFSGIGTGRHDLEVRAPGFERTVVEYDLGRDHGPLDVRVRPAQ